MTGFPIYSTTPYCDKTARYAIERKRMEQALQESERRYCGLVEMSREAVLIHSQGKLVFVSDAAAGLFGVSAPEQLRMSVGGKASDKTLYVR